MTDENAIKVSQGDLNEDRFDRFRLIKWWNQDRIGTARVLVVGAGVPHPVDWTPDRKD